MLGERLILKLYRLLEPGDNPDVEVGAFLADVGFADTPALAGSVTYEADGSRASAAMLQAYRPRRRRRMGRDAVGAGLGSASEASRWPSASAT